MIELVALADNKGTRRIAFRTDRIDSIVAHPSGATKVWLQGRLLPTYVAQGFGDVLAMIEGNTPNAVVRKEFVDHLMRTIAAHERGEVDIYE